MKVFYSLMLGFLLSLTILGCHGKNAGNPGSGDKIYITDRTGKKWNVTHATENYGFETGNFQYGLGPFAITPINNPEMISPGEPGSPDDNSTETRSKTVKAAREAGLLIGTCVEPVGPEHEIDEIVEKIIIGREMKPCYSGAMRRIHIPRSELEKYGMLTEYQMAFFVAVVRLAMGRHLMANCTHEPNLLGANSGANLFWVEVGTNPRDIEEDTSKGRGLDVYSCKNYFTESDYTILEGPSIFYSEENKIKGT